MLPMILEILTELSLLSSEKEKAIIQIIFIISQNSFCPSNKPWFKIVACILIKLLIYIS